MTICYSRLRRYSCLTRLDFAAETIPRAASLRRRSDWWLLRSILPAPTPPPIERALADPCTLELALLRLPDEVFDRLHLRYIEDRGGVVAGGVSGDARFDAWLDENIF